jgi:GNAT superfamily N-acetyltransferase
VPEDVGIRAAVAADLPGLLALYRQLYAELDLRLSPVVRDAWTATLSASGRTVLVAERDGTLVGTVDLSVVPNAAHAGQPYLLVENVVVDAAWRGRGVGRRLLDAARDHGRAAGCYKLQLSADDEQAFAFYEAVGLRSSARTYKEYLDPAGA